MWLSRYLFMDKELFSFSSLRLEQVSGQSGTTKPTHIAHFSPDRLKPWTSASSCSSTTSLYAIQTLMKALLLST